MKREVAEKFCFDISEKKIYINRAAGFVKIACGCNFETAHTYFKGGRKCVEKLLQC